jgi:MFS family permease
MDESSYSIATTLLHSPVMRQRAKAVVIAAVSLFLLYVLAPPLFFSDLNWQARVFFWGINAFLVVALLLCGVIWHEARHLPSAQLPNHSEWREPNRIPRSKQISHVVGSMVLLTWVVSGLLADDLYVPGRRSSGGIHLAGVEAGLIAGAAICAVANMLSVVVDHYDRRNNEIKYAHFAAVCGWCGWLLFFIAFLR